MDVAPLAPKVSRLNSWIEQQEERATVEVHRLQAVPFGHAEVTIDVTSTSPAASLNRNRIYLCGDGMLHESLSNLQRCGFREVYEQEV